MIESAQIPEVGAVGAKLLYPDGLIQHAGVIVGLNASAGHSHQFFEEYRSGRICGGHLNELLCVRECLAVTAACLMVRRQAFEAVGGFDETLEVGFGDTDLCLRIHAKGLKILWTPYARLIHYESASRGKGGDALHLHPKDIQRFCLRYEAVIHGGDPYYNPNLSPTSNRFEPMD
jgi:GT2 family glycosyltransferase